MSSSNGNGKDTIQPDDPHDPLGLNKYLDQSADVNLVSLNHHGDEYDDLLSGLLPEKQSSMDGLCVRRYVPDLAGESAWCGRDVSNESALENIDCAIYFQSLGEMPCSKCMDAIKQG